MEWRCRAAAFAAAVAFVLMGSGCVRARATPYRSLAPTRPDAVEVFSERLPDRAFEEIGLIEVDGAQVSSYGALIKKAQHEAAKMGAQAIIVSRRPIRGASALALDGPLPGAAVQETEMPRIWVVAITWKKD